MAETSVFDGRRYGLGRYQLRSDPYADLLRSLDVRAAGTPMPSGFGAPGFASPSYGNAPAASSFQPMAPAYSEPIPPPRDTPPADDRSWRISDAVAADPTSIMEMPASSSRAEGRAAGGQASTIASLIHALRSGASLNFFDEAQGLSSASGLPDYVPQSISAPVGLARLGLEKLGYDSGRSDAYASGRDYDRGYSEGSTYAHPFAAVAGNVAGGFALPMGAMRGAGLLGDAARGAVTGGLVGAIAGAGTGEDLQGRLLGAGGGATIGTATGGVGGAATGALGRLGRSEAPAIAQAADDGLPDLYRRAASQLDTPAFGSYGPQRAPTEATMADIRAAILEEIAARPVRPGTGASTPPPTAMPTFGPYGTPARATDDGMEAIRAGIMRHLQDMR